MPFGKAGRQNAPAAVGRRAARICVFPVVGETENRPVSRATNGYGADKDGKRQKRSSCVLTNSVFGATMFDCEIRSQDVESA